MEKTTLISGNGHAYEREVPAIRIVGTWNDGALDNLRKQTGIDFRRTVHGSVEGQPETWEQFAKIFLAYDFLTHGVNNWDGNYIVLRGNCNVPIFAPLYYEMDGKKFVGVE